MFNRLEYNEACEKLSLSIRMRWNSFVGYTVCSGMVCKVTSYPLPVALHDVPSTLQSLRRQQHIPGICDHEEMLGPTHKSTLIPSWLLDVDVE